MDWLEKIPQWIKIPLKILLPALFIFSSFILFVSDTLANKLYLKSFREENGAILGLIFVISLSLITVYLIFFILKPIFNKIKKEVLKSILENNTRKKIEDLKGNEKLIIYALHNISEHAYTFPMNDPVVNSLCNKGMIYTYKQQANVFKYTYQFGIIYSLQPIVETVISNILLKQDKKIEQLQNKYNKTKNSEKKSKIKKVLDLQTKSYNDLINLSLDKYYEGEEQWIN